MLHVIYDNIIVNPQRSEAPERTFSSEDVPHGTDSVLYKAAKYFALELNKNIILPVFSEEEKQSLIEQQKSKLSFVSRAVDEQGNRIEVVDESIPFHMQLKLEPPSDEEIIKKRDELRGYSEQDLQEFMAKRMAEGETITESEARNILKKCEGAEPTLVEAEAILREEIKAETAKRQIEYMIEECLIVPQLSDEFRAQFTTVDVPADYVG